MTNATDFHPVKTPTSDFPFPVGSTIRGGSGLVHVVVDRDGYAFVACCMTHEHAGTASGWHPASENGRLLSEFSFLSADSLDDCGRDSELVPLQDSDIGTVLECGCEVERGNLACDYHADKYGPAQPDCADCEFGIAVVYHEC